MLKLQVFCSMKVILLLLLVLSVSAFMPKVQMTGLMRSLAVSGGSGINRSLVPSPSQPGDPQKKLRKKTKKVSKVENSAGFVRVITAAKSAKSGGGGFGTKPAADVSATEGRQTEEATPLGSESLLAQIREIPVADDDRCPCGGVSFSSCCKPHLSNNAETATAAQLMRARFTAYKTNRLDFIIDTTHKSSPDYTAYFDSLVIKNPRKTWCKDIVRSITGGYAFVKIDVASFEFDGEYNASFKCRQLAIRREDNVMYPVEEDAILKRAHTQDEGAKGPWRYVRGAVNRPPPEVMKTMVGEWPVDMGMTLSGGMTVKKDRDGA